MSTSDKCCPLRLDSAVDVMVVGGVVKHWGWERVQFKFGGRDSVHVDNTYCKLKLANQSKACKHANVDNHMRTNFPCVGEILVGTNVNFQE